MDVPQGCALAEISSKVLYARLHYSVDPGKQAPEYKREGRLAMGSMIWDQQMEMKRDVYTGVPVFADYDDNRTCPIHVCRSQRIQPLNQRWEFFGFWDAGQTVNPAFLFAALTERPWQLLAIQELVCLEGGEDMEKFAPRVQALCQELLPGMWDQVYHIGDPTVATRSGSTGETARSVAKRVAGIRIHLGVQTWPIRFGAVGWLLRDMIEQDVPRFLIDGIGCPVLRSGFKGAYKWDIKEKDPETGPDSRPKMPLQNPVAHIQSALQYGAVHVQKQIQGRGATVRRLP